MTPIDVTLDFDSAVAERLPSAAEVTAEEACRGRVVRVPHADDVPFRIAHLPHGRSATQMAGGDFVSRLDDEGRPTVPIRGQDGPIEALFVDHLQEDGPVACAAHP